MNNKQQQQTKAKAPITSIAKKIAKRKPAVNPNAGRYKQGLKSAPVARQRVRSIAEPKFLRSISNGDVTVEHEELIQDINGSVAFSNIGLQINPGLVSTFPWLAQMAPLYESYLFEKLEFRFESTSATTAQGSLMMAVDYDASDPLAASKIQLATYRRYIRSAPWEECQCVSLLEDLRKQSTYFVRNGTLAANQDIKLYDVGLLNIAVQGQADASPIGELYIRYRVKFMTPQLGSVGVGNALSANFSGTTLALPIAKVGNAPLVQSGTGAVVTLTSTSPYQCLVSYAALGATITDVAGTGTAAITAAGELEAAGGTSVQAAWFCNFSVAGQTLVLTLTAASTTLVSVRVGQYAVSNG